MDILNEFLAPPMVILCLMIFIAVELQRRLIEIIAPNIKNSKWWREFFLPMGPPGTGGILGIILIDYPFPEKLSTISARIGCGIVCGLMSGMIYRMFKKVLFDKYNKQKD